VQSERTAPEFAPNIREREEDKTYERERASKRKGRKKAV